MRPDLLLGNAHRKAGPIYRDNLVGVLETPLDMLAAVLVLLGFTFNQLHHIPLIYWALSVLTFALTFPGPSRLYASEKSLVASTIARWSVLGTSFLAMGYVFDVMHLLEWSIIGPWLLSVPVAQLSLHFMLRHLAPMLRRVSGPPPTAIAVGLNAQSLSLAANLSENKYQNTRFCGFFDDRMVSRTPTHDEYAVLGRFSEILAYVKEHDIQEIYLSLPMSAEPRILQVVDDLRDTTASIFFVPDLFTFDILQGRMRYVNGMPVLSVCDTPFSGLDGFLKRGSDVVYASVILLLISPILLAIALAVKLSSPGPVIFKQRRYGLDGKRIVVYKFRTMTVCENGSDVIQAVRGDPRITSLGRLLRRTSLDELPQFVNVLQGHMSVVGPRPHAVVQNEMYRKLIKGYMLRHKVKPGITGWAQVNGFRGETDTLGKMQNRVNYDLDYIRNWSLLFDLRIMLRTCLLLILDKSAY